MHGKQEQHPRTSHGVHAGARSLAKNATAGLRWPGLLSRDHEPLSRRDGEGGE